MFNPKFTITPNILKSISQIEVAKEIIENSPLIPTFERKFVNETRARVIHYSARIEGNPLELSDAKKIVEGREDEVVARVRDIQEIINYRKTMDYIDKKTKAKGAKNITERDILEIHALIMDRILPLEECGIYRDFKIGTKNSHTQEFSYIAPKPGLVKQQVKDFFDWLKSNKAEELHPVLKAGIVHYEIARIHPFSDGSGRTARVLATLSLYFDDYDIKRFFCLEEHYDQNAASYYKALQLVQKADGDMTKWLEYFSQGVAIELNKVKEKVQRLSKDQKLRRTVGQVALNERQEKIIEFLQEYGRIQNRDWQELFPDVSDDTILRDLKMLQREGVVRKQGVTKRACYVPV